MNQRHHARQPSQGRKALPPHARPGKPPPLTTRRSYNHSHSHSHGGQPSPNKAAAAAWSKKVGVEDADDETNGMESFLQFCATCEKQIVTPDPSILYCSEACRRRDSRPTSIADIQAITQSISSPAASNVSATSYFDHPAPDIIPQRSPTIVRPMSLTFSELNLSDRDSPCSTDSSDRDSRRDSDAIHYLEQFYNDLNSSKPSRPRMSSRANTSTTGGDSNTNLPSLVHSPSSSYGTVASNASYRPLASRHNPFTSSYSATKSIELVIPYPTAAEASPTQRMKDASLKSSASAQTCFRVAEANDITYEKRDTSRRRRDSRQSPKADQSLKQLFMHEAMKASPK
ncbi:hypothetical protein AC578_6244 [Pseudocercospora eumusae]|uniref:Life-span regulatory factor domain-containing protein n=1 Tax=Pseudocercospora eumusae TaxID=321146 RepID=A0A139GZP0_9PEZI|nr:hypothetical protein AC578_6244 [Pseudocercospora eumusae]KXS95667.1 hypothetical protein AC578_6244 [Pseudocercospora eumusae]KXS95669.1 hypothetical protein AC578_6244 [Pseudocercospora eumusae]KXS95670.1 hypothetical protein AC578_6244 [Pseudocercospora eumusae]